MEPSGDINIINKYKRSQRSDLIPMLLEIQEYSGYITNDSLKEISKYLDIPISKIYGVSTFFNDIRFEKKGNFHIKVCRGTDCHINASESILNEISKQIGIKHGETTNDGNFSLEISECMGGCGNSPVIKVNDSYHTNVNVENISEILNYYVSKFII